jgi:MFS family permease
MGEDQAQLDESGMGLVLSLSTLGGLLASGLVGIAGRRLGRTAPLAVALLAGAALKLLSGTVTDPTWYIAVIIAWNTIYILAFIYIVATAAALDASGRWSAPVLGVYLIGSSFAPFFGTFVSAAAGYDVLGYVLAGMTLVLMVPLILISRISVRTEAAGAAVPPSDITAAIA